MVNKKIMLLNKEGVKIIIKDPKKISYYKNLIDGDKLFRCSYRMVKK